MTWPRNRLDRVLCGLAHSEEGSIRTGASLSSAQVNSFGELGSNP